MDPITNLEEAIKALPYDSEVTIWMRSHEDVPAGYVQKPIEIDAYDEFEKILDADNGIPSKKITLMIKID